MNGKENANKRVFYGGIAAAVAALVLAVFLLGKPGGLTAGGNGARVLAAAEQPQGVDFDDYEAYWERAGRLGSVPEAFSQALRQFAADSAYLALGQETKQNLCYSPLSFYTALAMVAETAQGETKEELLSCLHYDGAQLAGEMNRYLQLCFQENKVSVMKVANSLWLNENWFDGQAAGESIYNEETLQRLSEKYLADSYAGRFGSAELQKAMSSWVSKQTKGLLGGNPEAFALANDDVMSLVSTLYYYDQWIDRFDASNNVEDVFTCQDGTQVTAEYMRTSRNPYPVLAAEGYTAASLGMKGGSSITFVLPDEGVGPAELLADEAAMARLLGLSEEPQMQTAEVRFYIPKYHFGSSLDLTQTARGLGIETAFSRENADFSGLVNTAEVPVWLGAIRQQTSMSIDEKGCEAAAFTQIDYVGAAMPVDGVVELKLNRPFLIIVSAGEPLFIGVINRP